MQRLARVLGAVLLFQVLIKLSLQDLYSGFWIVRGFRTSNDKVSAACRALALERNLKVWLFHFGNLRKRTISEGVFGGLS